jgi:lipopolysaccharide/colanic/teichoic acid biosynthesis glycosyltransferase
VSSAYESAVALPEELVALPEELLAGPAQLGVGSPHATRFDAAVKRAVDVVVSAVLLLVLVPLIIAIVVAIKIDSRGPVFFRSERVGWRGRRLMMLKFRKMRDGAGGAPLTLADDRRFTRIGGWLARTKLDEIPQLWHVLRGDMSLVGPRPECSRFTELYPHEYDGILRARPGIVGLSQLAFVDEGCILDAHDPIGQYVEWILPGKVEMDLLYAQRRSLSLDLRVLLWGIPAVLLRTPVAVDHSTGRMTMRRRTSR